MALLRNRQVATRNRPLLATSSRPSPACVVLLGSPGQVDARARHARLQQPRQHVHAVALQHVG